eukprot:scaffold95067_cov60-Phaeocystis_antarctica.AAC.2
MCRLEGAHNEQTGENAWPQSPPHHHGCRHPTQVLGDANTPRGLFLNKHKVAVTGTSSPLGRPSTSPLLHPSAHKLHAPLRLFLAILPRSARAQPCSTARPPD